MNPHQLTMAVAIGSIAILSWDRFGETIWSSRKPARSREAARHDWNTQFIGDRTLGYGILLGRISCRLPSWRTA
jgi:hypothetical protein